jgi:hypothetical protein
MLVVPANAAVLSTNQQATARTALALGALLHSSAAPLLQLPFGCSRLVAAVASLLQPPPCWSCLLAAAASLLQLPLALLLHIIAEEGGRSRRPQQREEVAERHTPGDEEVLQSP